MSGQTTDEPNIYWIFLVPDVQNVEKKSFRAFGEKRKMEPIVIYDYHASCIITLAIKTPYELYQLTRLNKIIPYVTFIRAATE